MKALFLSALALIAVSASVSTASAYYAYGPNGYVQNNQSSTNYYGSNGQYLGSSRTTRW